MMPEFVGADFQNGWRPGVTDADYHADMSAVARGDCLEYLQSPKHFLSRRQFPHETDGNEDALRIGRAAHLMLLEPQKFSGVYFAMPEFGDMRSSTNRAKRDAWLAELPPEALPLKQEELDNLLGMVDVLLKHPTVNRLLAQGIREPVGYYRDPETGLKVRFKPDFINSEFRAVIDYKTTTDARRTKFAKTVWDWRYDLQLSKYAFGTKIITGWEPENHVIVAQEKERPWAVGIYELDIAAKELGHRDFRRALVGIAASMKEDKFLCYPEEVQSLGLPAYAFYD